MTDAAGLNLRDRAAQTIVFLDDAAREAAQRQLKAAGVGGSIEATAPDSVTAPQPSRRRNAAPFGEGSQVDTATPVMNTIEALGRKARSQAQQAASDPIAVSKFFVNPTAANSAMGGFPAGAKPDVIRACQYQSDDAASLKKPVLCQRMVLNHATGRYEQAADAFWSAPPMAQSGMSTLMAQGVILFETAVKRFNEVVGQDGSDPAFGSAVADQRAAWQATASANEAEIDRRAASKADLTSVIQSGMNHLQATAAARQAARAASAGSSNPERQPAIQSSPTPARAPTRTSPCFTNTKVTC